MLAELQEVNGAVVGVIRYVPRALHLAAECRDNGDWEFTDLGQFVAVAKELGITDMPPYTTFCLDKSPKAWIGFDWDSVPKTTRDAVMPHQREAIDKAIVQHGGRSLIASGMGTGKTLMGVMLADHYGNALIICPASKVSDWCKEYVQWTGRAPPMALKSGEHVVEWGPVVASYETLKRNAKMLKRAWSVVIVDECHKLKNDNKRSDAIMPVLKRTPALIMLSGTPIESRPSELYNALNALCSGTFNDRDVFMNRYADRRLNPWGVWEERGAKNLRELNLVLSRVMFRFDSSGLMLEPIRRVMVMIDPTVDQKARLEELEGERIRLAMVEQDAVGDAATKAARYARFVHTNLAWHTAGQMKVEGMLEWVRQLIAESDEKCVFFVHHLDLVEKLVTMLPSETVVITGSTSQKKRDEAVAALRFGSARFGVLSIEASGEGINLVPGVTRVVFVELHRNSAKMEQAEARVHRIGLSKRGTAYWLILGESSDSALVNALQHKLAVTTEVMSAKRGRFEFT